MQSASAVCRLPPLQAASRKAASRKLKQGSVWRPWSPLLPPPPPSQAFRRRRRRVSGLLLPLLLPLLPLPLLLQWTVLTVHKNYLL